jgi:uncharacterized protein YkwD
MFDDIDPTSRPNSNAMNMLSKIPIWFLVVLPLFLVSCLGEQAELGSDLKENLINKKAMLKAVNQWRQAGCKCGGQFMPPVPKLTWSDKLEEAALRHSKDMAEANIFSHTGSDGSSHGERIEETGYSAASTAENIAGGSILVSEEEQVQSWINSPGHCKNIMRASITEIGAALYRKDDSRYVHYWTQVFGKQL